MTASGAPHRTATHQTGIESHWVSTARTVACFAYHNEDTQTHTCLLTVFYTHTHTNMCMFGKVKMWLDCLLPIGTLRNSLTVLNCLACVRFFTSPHLFLHFIVVVAFYCLRSMAVGVDCMFDCCIQPLEPDRCQCWRWSCGSMFTVNRNEQQQ